VTTPTADAQPHTSTLTIRPPSGWGALGVRDLWEYRELLYFLTKRELQIRYKQSFLGVSWAILQPLTLAFIFALFFGVLAHVPSDGVPYPLFALGGLVPWVFVSQSVSQAASSLVGDANLLSKVYFPRLVLPVARILALLVDLAISTVILIAFTLVYGVSLHSELVLLPLFLLLAIATAIGAGVLLAAVNVQYRDVGVAVPLMMQIWLFATPVIYPGTLIEGKWQYVYALNPMVSVIGGVRWVLFGSVAPTVAGVAISVGVVVVVGLAAIAYFRRSEQFFADVV
jgi:lipopolysaccharide transport system permease protein